MSFQRQAQALLDIARAYQAARCQAMLSKARDDWQSVVKAAHADARRELRARLVPERERIAAEVARAEARLITQRRRREQRRVAVLLQQAWPRLAQTLRDRWDQPATRAAWVSHQLELALALFPADGWEIRHPESWPAAECAQAAGWLQERGVRQPRFSSDPELAAGIRIRCGLNLLDASLDGLLADRTQIEGRLLHHLERRS